MIRIMVVVLALAFSGCNDDTGVNQNDIEKLNDSNSGYALSFEKAMEFEQGQEGSYEIIASVPSPGNPIIESEGLPEGAVIEDGWLHFTPPCQALLTEGRYFRGYETFHIRLTLRSDADADSVVQEAGFILVHQHRRADVACGEE